MQPCAVCGGVQVDAAGYCTQCRTFRGVPQQPPPQPPNYPQPQQSPYSGYPPGSPAYPTSVPPGYPQQTSGGGYPMSYPAAPAQPGRRSFVVPLVALAATLGVLVTAIVIVVAVRSGGDEPGPGPVAGATTRAGSTPSASATPASDVDECVVGDWRVTSHKEDIPVEGRGKVTFTGGDGATLQLNADGTGEFDYKSGTEYEGELSGQAVRLELSGRVTYHFTARNGSLAITDVESTATGKLYFDNEQYGDPLPLNPEEDTSTYTCSGDTLTQKTFLFTTEYERVS
jgi:hypothetical protein